MTDSKSDCDDVCGFSSSHEPFQNLLFESLNREKLLKKVLNEQQLKNDQLQMQLELERSKNVMKSKKFETTFEDLNQKALLKAFARAFYKLFA